MIPLAYLLLVYGFFVLISLLFLFFNIFHLAKFGLEGSKTYALITVYIVSVFGILGISLFFLAGFDWTQTIDFAISFDMPNL